MPTVLRAAVIVEGETGGKVYYIRNVATGLYVKHGGTWGTHAVEGRAAHPFALEAWANDVYAISSVNGYLSSTASGQSDVKGFFMESTNRNDSKWKLVKVDATSNTSDYYYIESNGRRFASQSHASGQIGLANPDNNDARQQWQILTKDELVPAEISVAEGAEPVSIDVTALIDGSSFDLVDGVSSTTAYPLHGSITGFATKVEYRNVAWPSTHGESGENGVWMRTGCWDTRDADPMVYNSAFITRNNVHGAFTVSQALDYKLPAGNYTFSFEGFYARRHSGGGNEDMNVSMKIKGGTEEKIVYFSKNQDITSSTFINGETKMTLNGVEYNRENYAAALFRDNDDYIQTIAFTVPAGGSVITIEISKPETNETGGWDWILGDQTWQNMIACDNFTLTYHGKPVGTTNTDLAILYYDRVRAAYLYATDKLYELAGNSYDDACKTEDGCVHWTKWDAAITGKVSVNGIDHVRGITPTTPTEKYAYLNGNNKIDTEKEFLEALAKIEEAYQAALAEHNSHLNDFTGKIMNNSFELGHLQYWTVPGLTLNSDYKIDGRDINVFLASDQYKYTSNADGSYLFNAYDSDGATGTPGIQQTIEGLQNGLYKLEALLTSFQGNYVYLKGNTYHDYIIAENKDKFEEAELYFLVEDGTATIGAVGGNSGLRPGELGFKYFFPYEGCFFKADNFRLTYICDVPNGKLKLALDEANKANDAFDEFGQASIASTIANYQEIYDGKTATDANVDGYVTAIHTALNTAAKQQQTINADMTYAIKNPNFEWSWIDDEWIHTPGEDSGIQMQEALNWWGGYAYRTVGANGRYLFNTWKNNAETFSVTGKIWDSWHYVDHEYTTTVNYESAEPLTQTLTGLPNGTYNLEAMLTTHRGETMVLTANGESAEQTIGEPCQGDNGVLVSVECEVTDGTLDIEVVGKEVTKTATVSYKYLTGSGFSQKLNEGSQEFSYSYTPWFKADDFRLTLLKPQLLILDEKATVTPKIENQQFDKVRVKRTIKQSSNWSTFVLPFDINLTADTWLANSKCVVKELKRVNIDGEHVRLTFGDPQTSIEAGVPCIIKNEGAGALEYIEVEKVNVDTRYRDTEAQTVYYEDENHLMRFHGVYHRRAIPQDAFFISSNKFYKAVGPKHQNPDMISGFRGYFEILNTAGEQGARAFSFRIGEDETAVEEVNNGPATVVAIYNLSGMRLDGMQDGVNILQMSDGTSIKVVIE